MTMNGSGSVVDWPSSVTCRSSNRLEQGGLSFGRRAVHLVREHDVREYGAEPDAERARRDLEDARPDDVARIRSGVNWIRLKLPPISRAAVRARSVFAVPGTPSMRMWPRSASAMNTRRMVLVLTDDHLVNARRERRRDVHKGTVAPASRESVHKVIGRSGEDHPPGVHWRSASRATPHRGRARPRRRRSGTDRGAADRRQLQADPVTPDLMRADIVGTEHLSEINDELVPHPARPRNSRTSCSRTR